MDALKSLGGKAVKLARQFSVIKFC